MDALANNTISSSVHSTESLTKKSTSSNCSVSSSSCSYDENIVDLGACSDRDSHTRPNSIVKHKTDSSSSENNEKDTEILRKGFTQLNGIDFHKVCNLVFLPVSIFTLSMLKICFRFSLLF